MNYRTLSFLFFFFLNVSFVFSQTEASFFEHINYLCSEKLHGRGAEFSGDSIAANYLAKEYKKLSLEKIKGSYYQPFTYDVNTFPAAYSLSINGQPLAVGKEFIAQANAKSGKGVFKAIRLTTQQWEDATFRHKFLSKPLHKKVLVYDHALTDTKIPDYFKLALAKEHAAGLVEVMKTDPIASEADNQLAIPTFLINESTLEKLGDIKTVQFDLETTLIKNYKTQNVVGLIKGNEQPDSYLIVSAHYDHIGHFGKDVMLQGANDNASGVAMLLSLAAYFSKPENQPKKSILFICFAAEEIGLLGSQHYVHNPLLPLNTTDFVLNLDLMGSGSEGITVVNGEELQTEYQLLDSINTENNFITEIKNRKNRANSDHFPFTEKGINAFFIYARGTVGGYHNLGDTVDKLEHDQFDRLLNLFVEFLKVL